MTRPTPLPEPLASRAFAVREAHSLGVTPGRLRSSDLDRTFHGVRAPVPPGTPAERCRLLSARLSSRSFFSHSTAALLLGAPLPRRLEVATALHVSVPRPSRAPRGRNVIGHASSAPEAPITVHGVRISPPARTWCDLGALLGLDDLVAVGDYLIARRSPLTTSEDLRKAATAATSRRGARTIQAALPLLSERSESRPESRLRVLMVCAGLGEPRVNYVVTNRFGEFVARTDLELPDLGIVLEYQGDYHRTNRLQWRADMSRRSKLEATVRRVMELNADDLGDPLELAHRILALAKIARPNAELPRLALTRALRATNRGNSVPERPRGERGRW